MLARLQLAVGEAAVLLGEVGPDGPRRRFAARGPRDQVDGPPTRLLVLHPPPPDGPHAGVLLDRMASIRAIGHGVLAPPMATGAFEGRGWAVEPFPAAPTIAERLAAGERFAVPEAVHLLREVSRALAGLHRHNLVHGVVGPEAVTMQREVVTLHRLASRHGGALSDDLHALGRLGWLMLTGQEPSAGTAPLRAVRPTVPEELEGILGALLHPAPDVGLPSAAAVLEALDVLPVAVPSQLGSLMDGAGRGSRLPLRRRGMALAVVGLAAALLAFWLLT